MADSSSEFDFASDTTSEREGSIAAVDTLSSLRASKDTSLLVKPFKSAAVGKYPSRESRSAVAHSESIRSEPNSFLCMDAFTRHKLLVNDYLTHYGGSWKEFQRDSSDDKRDIDIIRQHHQFLWEDSDKTDEWGSRLAKKYWDKLFKEYCIVDLTLYKQNKIGMRWRLEKEVASGKGQFICGNKVCHVGNNLRSWEVHFGYVEQEQKKNALVKVRLCPTCSDKLNFHHKRREVVPAEKLSSVPPEEGEPQKKQRKVAELMVSTSSTAAVVGENVWSKSAVAVVDKSQEEEFDEYISDLFL